LEEENVFWFRMNRQKSKKNSGNFSDKKGLSISFEKTEMKILLTMIKSLKVFLPLRNFGTDACLYN